MKKWKIAVLVIFIGFLVGCAATRGGLVVKEPATSGILYGGVIVNPTRFDVRVRSVYDEELIKIRPGKAVELSRPAGTVRLSLDYYQGGKRLATVSDWGVISAGWREHYWEGKFYYWKVVIKAPSWLDP